MYHYDVLRYLVSFCRRISLQQTDSSPTFTSIHVGKYITIIALLLFYTINISIQQADSFAHLKVHEPNINV